MRKSALILILLALMGCSHGPIVADAAGDKRTPSEVAEEWLKCPPPNPRRPHLCRAACCGDGSNWYMSCITFVGETTREAHGAVDSDLMKGYSKNPPFEYGNPMLAWAAMKASGRARTDFENMESGSVVFFSIPTFPPGHVAIYTGEKNVNGVPLIVTTGGFKNRVLRKEPMTKTAADAQATLLGWAKL